MTLLAEIQAKCDVATLASRDEVAIASALNETRVKKTDVSAATVRGLLYAFGKWGGIVAKANAARANADVSQVALACQTLYDLAASDQPIPMGNPAIEARVTADLALMVADGLMAQPVADAVLGLGVISDSVTPFEVRSAIWAADGTCLI